MNKEKMVIIW